VSDGRELWIYYPNFKSAERYPLGKGPPLDADGSQLDRCISPFASRLTQLRLDVGSLSGFAP
jgi:hypothetical protein